MPNIITSADAFANQLAFTQSQAAHVETEVYKIQYPDIQYPGLAPIDTSANPFAESIVYYSQDGQGEADFLANRANDFPLVATQREQHTVRIENLGIGYDWDIFEVEAAMLVNMNLRSDKAEIAFRVHQEKIDDIFLRGQNSMGWDGLINSSAVTASTASGTGNARKWDQKTGEEIAADVNDALNSIVEDSLQVEMADTVLMPVKMLNLLATRKYKDGEDGMPISILEYIKRYNVYTATTGRQLTIRTLRGLESAGANNDRPGRLICYPNNSRVLKFHMPMPLRWLPVQQWLQKFVVAGIFRLGGLEIRRPKAMRYIDQIM